MRRLIIGLALVGAVVLYAAPASAGLLGAIDNATPGQVPEALAGMQGNAIVLTRVLVNILVTSSLVGMLVQTLAETRSVESLGYALSRVWMWLVFPLLTINVVLGMFPTLGAWFMRAGSYITGQPMTATTPAGIMHQGVVINVALSNAGSKLGDTGLLGPNLVSVFSPRMYMSAVGFGTGLIATLCFAAIAVVLARYIFSLFLATIVGAWRLALLGADCTRASGLAYIFELLSKGSQIVTVIVMSALIFAEASTWPAFIGNANISNFLSRAAEVDAAAIFCTWLTWSVAKDIGMQFVAGAAQSIIMKRLP